MFETVEEGFDYVESFVNVERGGYSPRRWRLERMRALLEAFGDPHRAYPTIHVAGSKGKGSTAAYAAHILHAAGHRVGLYTSPHVESYRERVRVLDGSLTDDVFLAAFDRIASWVNDQRLRVRTEELPTTFELVTLLAFLVFREVGCAFASIEVGLGGRLDATNLVRPVVSIITPIELEHTEYLGPTLRSIAGEKAAIIKRGTPVAVSRQHPEAMRVIERVAQLRRAPLASIESIGDVESHPDGLTTTVRFTTPRIGRIESRLRMMGSTQARNAALAALAIDIALPDTPPAAVEQGLRETWLPGRSEILPGSPPLLIDGAHTPASIALVCEIVRSLCPDRAKRAIIFGAVSGKSHTKMLEHVVETFDSIVICEPGTFKSSDPDGLARICRHLGKPCAVINDGADAIAHARSMIGSSNGLMVGTGSFYLAGKLRTAHRTGSEHVA